MLKCTVDAFLSDYSPFLPNDALVDAAIQTLALLVTEEHNEPLLWKFFKGEPSSGFPETSILEAVADIAGIFNNKVEELNGRKHVFLFRSHDAMKSKIPGSNLTLDARFFGNSGLSSDEHDICAETAVAVRATGCIKDSEDDREKLVSAVRHIMNNDPRRMWMYGITIEHTKMAVWHFSRSRSVKSELFDVTKDFRTFIRVFLSFAYATPDEMGYDPTVHRIINKRLQYVYEIPTENGTRYFKTIDLIAHQGAHCITGRQTRVWKAVEVKGLEGNAVDAELNGGRRVALKDVWLDDGSKTEKKKLDAIFESLRTIKEEAYQWAPPSLRSKLKTVFENEGYKEYFMEIVCDNFNLGRSKNASDSVTPAPEILQLGADSSVSNDGWNGAEAPSAHNSKEGNSAEYSDMLILAQLTGYGHIKARPYKTKRQYRLVYKEVGVSLDRVETLETAFNALLDTYIALVLMYLAGWMHRDVSAGNIIAVKRPDGKSGGKLSDLEYAKHCEDDTSSSDPKTGTAFFMPLEVHMGRAYKRAHAISQSSNLPEDIPVDPYNPRLSDDAELFPDEPPLEQELKYRFQHDLESLWWVTLYILIYRVAHPPAEELCKKVFQSTSLPSLARQQLFDNSEAVMRSLQKFMHPALQHKLIMRPMNAIPDILYDSYFMDEPVGPEALGRLYGNFFQNLALVFIKIMTGVKDVKLRPSRHVKSKKRAHPEMSSKHRDDDEYQGEEEPGSDGAVRRRRKRTSTSTSVRR